jgi:hypothetical protein
MRGRHLPKLLAAGIAVVVAAAAVFAPTSHARAAGPAVGVVADITWGITSAAVDQTVASMVGSGATWVRANVNWAAAEPNGPGLVDESWLTQTDYAIGKARSAGLNVLMPISDGVPYWASADPNKYTDSTGPHWNKTWRPVSFGDYAQFVSYVVNRYKAVGVDTYELWNEPNTARFWPSGPSAAEFTSLLAAAYPAAKQADPNATVLMGGLSKNDYTYLQQMYAAGAAPYFDAVAVHPYTGSADPTWCWDQSGTTQLAVDAFCGIEQVRSTMVTNGDAAKSIWLTEFGWSTSSGTYGVSESTQASYLTSALTKVASYPYVTAAFWYSFRDTGTDPTDYESNLGLLRNDFTTKPAYDAMRNYTGGPPPSPSPTPVDTQPPVLSGIAAGGITRGAATITWTSSEPATSSVDYWVGTQTARTVSSSTLVTGHSVALSGLARATKYYFRVRSADAAGNSATSATYSFTTARK